MEHLSLSTLLYFCFLGLVTIIAFVIGHHHRQKAQKILQDFNQQLGFVYAPASFFWQKYRLKGKFGQYTTVVYINSHNQRRNTAGGIEVITHLTLRRTFRHFSIRRQHSIHYRKTQVKIGDSIIDEGYAVKTLHTRTLKKLLKIPAVNEGLKQLQKHMMGDDLLLVRKNKLSFRMATADFDAPQQKRLLEVINFLALLATQLDKKLV